MHECRLLVASCKKIHEPLNTVNTDTQETTETIRINRVHMDDKIEVFLKENSSKLPYLHVTPLRQ